MLAPSENWPTAEVEFVSLRDALDMLPQGYCDLLKLDCEGTEYQIINSSDQETAQRIHNIIYEATGHLYIFTESRN